MTWGKIFRQAALLVIAMIFFTSATTYAEIKSYEGVGEYFLTDETIDYAKEQAELEAQSDILEKVSVYVKGISVMIDHELDSDEIITVSAGILRVIETKFNMKDDGDGITVKSFVTAEIDIEEVVKLLEQLIKDRKSE